MPARRRAVATAPACVSRRPRIINAAPVKVSGCPRPLPSAEGTMGGHLMTSRRARRAIARRAGAIGLAVALGLAGGCSAGVPGRTYVLAPDASSGTDRDAASNPFTPAPGTGGAAGATDPFAQA